MLEKLPIALPQDIWKIIKLNTASDIFFVSNKRDF